MKEILVGLAMYTPVLVNPQVVEDAVAEAAPPAIVHVQYGRLYRSPYRYYYPGPGYRTPYWGRTYSGQWCPRCGLVRQFYWWRGY